MNCHDLDAQIGDIDTPAEEWADMLSSMFDDEAIDVIEIEDDDEGKL